MDDVLDHPNIYPMRDGHAVARSSDFIIYSVEATSIVKVVAEYGPCMLEFDFFALNFSHNSTLATKMYAVVAGQTSVKAPEKAAFEKHLPEDVHIVSCHSLHGPTVNPIGQPLVSLIILFPHNIINCKKFKGNNSTSWIE